MDRKLILFDIDGTLLATGGAGIHALRAAATEIFGDDDLQEIDIARRTDSSIARQLFAKHGREAAPEEITRFFDSYLSNLERYLPQVEGSLLPGVLALLEKLKQRPDYVLALLTGNLTRGAELKLTQYGIWHFFDFGAYADDHHDRNELGPVVCTRARERFGCDFPPERIYVLGDTPHDIACARAIGAKAVGIATGRHSLEELKACSPDLLFRDLNDVEAVIAALV